MSIVKVIPVFAELMHPLERWLIKRQVPAREAFLRARKSVLVRTESASGGSQLSGFKFPGHERKRRTQEHLQTGFPPEEPTTGIRMNTILVLVRARNTQKLDSQSNGHVHGRDFCFWWQGYHFSTRFRAAFQCVFRLKTLVNATRFCIF